MKKVTVIVGEACSGKSRLSMELVKEFDPSDVLLVDGKNLKYSKESKKLILRNISKKTKVIISDDTSLDSIPFLLFEVMVRNSNIESSPYGRFGKMIIVCDAKITRNHFPQEVNTISSLEILDTKDCYKENL